jgi:hypothetical protein
MSVATSTPILRLASGPLTGKVVEVPTTLRLGRHPFNEVSLGDPGVSRYHCWILVRDGATFVEDLASANGTFVNGERIAAPHLLADRDAIGLGVATPVLRFIDPDPTVVPAARLRYDERTLRFLLDAEPLELTPNELRLLRYLFAHAGAVCPREACAAAIWGPDFPPGYDADTLDRVVSTLRGKLRRAAPDTDLLHTRPGLGYTLDP